MVQISSPDAFVQIEYMFLGSTGSFGLGNRDIYLICTNASGEEIWTKTYGTDGYNCAFDMIEINNNGYAIVGHTDVHGTEFLDVYYLKLDAEGNEVLTKRFESEYKFYDYGKSLIQTSQGYIAICGATKVKADRSNDIYMMIIDDEAEILYEKVIGNTGSEWSTSLCETADGNFAVIGHTNSEGEGKFDALLLKLQNPYVSINSISPHDSYFLPVSPNPTADFIDLNFIVGINENAAIQIFDNSGKPIFVSNDFSSGRHFLRWNCSDLNSKKVSPGIYHIVLSSNHKVQAQKLVII